MACRYIHKGNYYSAEEILKMFNSPVEKINAAREWLISNTGMNPEELVIVDGLIENVSMARVIEDGRILISSLAPESVYYHEAFHRIFNLFATDLERLTLINEFKTRKDYKSAIERLDRIYNSKQYVELRKRKLTEEELIEEQLAEDFYEYKISREADKSKLSLFERIYNFITKILNLEPKLSDSSFTNQFYQRIINSQFQRDSRLNEKLETYKDSALALSIPGLNYTQSLDMVYGIHTNFIDVLLEENKFYDLVDGKKIDYDTLFMTALKRAALNGDPQYKLTYLRDRELLKVRHKALLDEFRILTGEDRQEFYDSFFDENKYKDTESYKNSILLDPKLSTRKAIRILLSALTSSEKNSLGGNAIFPVKESNKILLDNLSNIPPTLEDFKYVLNRLTNSKPHLQKVSGILEAEIAKGNTRFVNDFISSFNNAYTNLDLLTDLNGDFRIISANQKNIRDQIVGSWKANLETKIETDQFLAYAISQFTLNKNTVKDFFSLLGVDLKTEPNLEEATRIKNVISELLKNPNFKSSFLKTIFDTTDRTFMYEGNNLSYIFSDLVMQESKFRDDLDIMIFNADGKPVYPISKYHYLSMVINWSNYYIDRYKQDKSIREQYPSGKDGTIELGLTNYLRDKMPFLFNYNTISSYFLDSIKKGNKLSFELFSGINIGDNKLDFSNASDFDYYAVSLSLFSNGKMLSITQGDRQLSPIFKVPIINEQFAKDRYLEYIKSEILRLHNANNPNLNFDKIQGLKPKTKEGSNELDPEQIGLDPKIADVVKIYNSIKTELENTDSPLTVIEAKLDELKSKIFQNLTDFFNKQTENYISKFKELNLVKDIDSFLLSDYIKRGDKTLKDFVKDWFINNYFSNIEQGKLFYGNISVFNKYSEFWKRMNTPTSTGDPSITSKELLESLEKRDDKDSFEGFNYADARAANGVSSNTIKEQFLKDNEVKSYYLETIEKKVRQYYTDLYSIFRWEDRFNSLFPNEKPNLEKLIESDVKKHIKGFSKINEADGFSYINLFEWRRVMDTFGLWTSSHDELFKTELEVLKISMDESLSIQEKKKRFNQLFSKGKSVEEYFEMVAQASLLKPQYAGPVYNMNFENYAGLTDIERANIYGIRKTSFLPLLPSLIFNTQLETVHNKMLKSGTGILFYESAAKIGRSTILHDINKITETEANEFETLNGAFSTYIDYSYLKNQVYIEAEEKTKIIDSTQSRANILADKYHEGVPFDFMFKNKGKLFEEIKSDWQSLSEDQKRSQSNFHKNSQDFIRITSQIVEGRRNKLLEELKVVAKNKELTEFDIQNINVIIDFLKREANERGNSIDVIQAFDYLLENNDALFNIFPNVNKLQSIITSIVTNNAVRIKRSGSDYAQVSPSLFREKGTSRSNLSESDSEVLKTYEIDETLKPSEIIIPASREMLESLEKAIKKGKNKTIMAAYNSLSKQYPAGFNIKRLVDTLNILIEDGYLDSEVTYKGLRIPNQELSSNDVMKVKKFALPTMAKFVIVNAELISKTGSDFDIDKLNLYFKYLNEDLKEITQGDSEEALFNQLAKIEQELILNEYNVANLMHPVEDAGLQDLLVNKIEVLQDKTQTYSYREKNKKLYEVYLPENNLQKKSDLSQANMGIGQLAKQVVNHTKARNAILAPEFENETLLGKPITLSTSLMFIGYENNNTFDKYFTDDLESIPQLQSGFLTTQVDAAKEPYAAYLNIKTYVNPVISYLIRRGISKEVAMTFVTQPAIIEYINKRAIFSSPIYKFKQRPEKLNKRIFKSLKSIIGKASIEEIADLKKIDPKDLLTTKARNDKEFQKNVLLYFLSLKEQTYLFDGFNNLLSADTRYHKSLISYLADISTYEELKNSNFIENMDEMLTTGFAAPFVLSSKLYYYPWRSLFLSTRDFGSQIGPFINAYSDAIADSMYLPRNSEQRQKMKQSMERQFLFYIFDNYLSSQLPQIELNSKLIYLFKNLKDVDLSKIFSPLEFGGKNIIQGKIKTFTNYELNNYISIFSKVYASPSIQVSTTENMSGKDFVTQLYLQSLRQTKNDYSSSDFSSVIPGNLKAFILRKFLSEFLKKEGSNFDEIMKNFVRVFQMNNRKYVGFEPSVGLLYKKYDRDKKAYRFYDDAGVEYQNRDLNYDANFKNINLVVEKTSEKSIPDNSYELGQDDDFDLDFYKYAKASEQQKSEPVSKKPKDFLSKKLNKVKERIAKMEMVKIVNGEFKDLFYQDNSSKFLVNGVRSFIRQEILEFEPDGKLFLKPQQIENEGDIQTIPRTQIGTFSNYDFEDRAVTGIELFSLKEEEQIDPALARKELVSKFGMDYDVIESKTDAQIIKLFEKRRLEEEGPRPAKPVKIEGLAKPTEEIKTPCQGGPSA